MYSVISRAMLGLFGAVILAFPLSSSQTVFSQTTKGEAMVQGHIADSAGASLPGASVTLNNLSTGLERVAIAGASGSFVFKIVRDGRYRLTASFAPVSREVESRSAGAIEACASPCGFG